MNKKAIIGSIAIIGFILALGIIFLANAREEVDQIRFVGQDALDLSQKALTAEKSLLVRDIKARHSFYKAIEELNNNGGLLKADCSAFNEYALWNSEEIECYPENYKDHLITLFIKNFEFSNYDFSVTENAFIGKAKEKTEISSSKITYGIYQHFKIQHDFTYNKVILIAKKIVADCPTSTITKQDCIQSFLDKFNKNHEEKINLGPCNSKEKDQ